MAVAEIPIDQSRILECFPEIVCVNLRVDVSVDLNNVRPAIVVIADKAASPRYIAFVDPDAGTERQVAEGTIPVVVVKIAGVIDNLYHNNGDGTFSDLSFSS